MLTDILNYSPVLRGRGAEPSLLETLASTMEQGGWASSRVAEYLAEYISALEAAFPPQTPANSGPPDREDPVWYPALLPERTFTVYIPGVAVVEGTVARTVGRIAVDAAALGRLNALRTLVKRHKLVSVSAEWGIGWAGGAEYAIEGGSLAVGNLNFSWQAQGLGRVETLPIPFETLGNALFAAEEKGADRVFLGITQEDALAAFPD